MHESIRFHALGHILSLFTLLYSHTSTHSVDKYGHWPCTPFLSNYALWLYFVFLRLFLDEPVQEPRAHSMPAAPNVVPYHLKPPPSSVAIQPGTKH